MSAIRPSRTSSPTCTSTSPSSSGSTRPQTTVRLPGGSDSSRLPISAGDSVLTSRRTGPSRPLSSASREQAQLARGLVVADGFGHARRPVAGWAATGASTGCPASRSGSGVHSDRIIARRGGGAHPRTDADATDAQMCVPATAPAALSRPGWLAASARCRRGRARAAAPARRHAARPRSQPRIARRTSSRVAGCRLNSVSPSASSSGTNAGSAAISPQTATGLPRALAGPDHVAQQPQHRRMQRRIQARPALRCCGRRRAGTAPGRWCRWRGNRTAPTKPGSASAAAGTSIIAPSGICVGDLVAFARAARAATSSQQPGAHRAHLLARR